MSKTIKCPKCKNDNITVQLMQGKSTTKTKEISGNTKGMRTMMNIATFGIWGMLTGQKAAKSITKSKTEKVALCQSCGHDWKI